MVDKRILKDYILRKSIDTFGNRITFEQRNGQIYGETEISTFRVKRLLGIPCKMTVSIVLHEKYFTMKWTFIEPYFSFDFNKINDCFEFFDKGQYIYNISNNNRSLNYYVKYENLGSETDFDSVYIRTYLFLEMYVFSIGEEIKIRENERLRMEEAYTLNNIINKKLLKSLEKTILNEMKERFKKLITIDRTILECHKGGEKDFLEGKYYLSNTLIDYFEKNAIEKVSKNLIDILYSPWVIGNTELLDEIIEKNHGYLYSDVILTALYFSFTGARSIGLKEIRNESNIREVEKVLLNYISDEIIKGKSIDVKEIDNIFIEAEVVLLRKE